MCPRYFQLWLSCNQSNTNLTSVVLHDMTPHSGKGKYSYCSSCKFTNLVKPLTFVLFFFDWSSVQKQFLELQRFHDSWLTWLVTSDKRKKAELLLLKDTGFYLYASLEMASNIDYHMLEKWPSTTLISGQTLLWSSWSRTITKREKYLFKQCLFVCFVLFLA